MKNIFKNYFFMYISIYLPKILSFFILTPFLANTIGLNGNGIISYTNSILNWAILIATFGISTYGSKKIAETRDNKNEMIKNFSSIFFLQLIFHLIILINYLFFINFFHAQYKVLLLIFSIFLLFDSFDIGWFFSGTEDFKNLSIKNLIYYTIMFILTIALIKNRNDIYMYAISMYMGEIIGILYMLIIFFKKYGNINFNISNLSFHFKNCFSFFIPTFLISIYTIFDQIMLGSLSNTNNVALYSRAESYVKLAIEMITLISTIILPKLSNLHNKNSKKEKEYFNKVFDILLMFSIPLTFGFIATSKSFISWYLPKDFFEVSNLIILLSPITILISIGRICGIYLTASNNIKKYSISLFIGAVSNFIINLIFIRSLGAYAAVISTLISEGIVTTYLIISVKKFNIINLQKNNILSYIISSIIMFFVVFNLSNFFSNSVIFTIIEIIIGIIVYFNCIFIFKKLKLIK